MDKRALDFPERRRIFDSDAWISVLHKSERQKKMYYLEIK
jgi:hypothetical protein